MRYDHVESYQERALTQHSSLADYRDTSALYSVVETEPSWTLLSCFQGIKAAQGIYGLDEVFMVSTIFTLIYFRLVTISFNYCN